MAAACQEQQQLSDCSISHKYRFYPNVIRRQQKDGSFKVIIEKTNIEFIHFKIVDKIQLIPPSPDYTSEQFNPSSPIDIHDNHEHDNNNHEHIYLSPPPPPCKLIRSFREYDRPLYDPLFWKSTNKQNNCNSKKYLFRYYNGVICDSKINNWRTRHPDELCKVQLCCHNLEEDSHICWSIWKDTYWNNKNKKLLWDLEWKISKDHSFINYQVPRHFSVVPENNEYYKYYNENDFYYIPVIYKSLFFALIKFKIILYRIRIKKRIRLFLLSTTYSSNILKQQSSLLNKFGGSSNLLIRHTIIRFLCY